MTNLDRKLDYYKWFWRDYRADRKVQRMTYIERGLYRELLDECWAEGCIPDDIGMLADICDCPVDVMTDAWQVLSKCFVDSGNCLANGKQLLANEKLDSVRTAKDSERIKKSIAGKKGGIAKALNNKDIVANASNSQANASKCHIEEKRREENTTSEKSEDQQKHTKKYSDEFERFWSAYPNCKRKQAKGNCYQIWKRKKLDKDVEEILENLDSMSTQYTKNDHEFCPMTSRHLNAMGWDGFEVGMLAVHADPHSPEAWNLR